MPRYDFYHLQKWPLEQALPKLLDKVLQSGHRAVLMAGSAERVEALTVHLWGFDREGWLPHGSARDGHAEEQPIYLTADDENPNGATILVLTDGTDAASKDTYARCLDLFDGHDEAAVQAARTRWKAALDKGWELHYWQQTDHGGWQEKAAANAG